MGSLKLCTANTAGNQIALVLSELVEAIMAVGLETLQQHMHDFETSISYQIELLGHTQASPSCRTRILKQPTGAHPAVSYRCLLLDPLMANRWTHQAGADPYNQFATPRDDKLGKVRDPLLTASRWLKRRSQKEKVFLGSICGLLALVLMWLVIEDHDNLFIMAEFVHFAGIGMLLYKLFSKKNAGGLSLRSQELTALFLGIRLFCSFMMEYDIHTFLDLLTLLATSLVIYMLWFPLRDSYQAAEDNIQSYFVAVPCLLLAFIAKPGTQHKLIFRIMWAVCVYIEAVSVLPQLRMMQKAKVVEKFTAHYVFALGISRFISCAHWILQIIDGDSFLLQAIGSGIWPAMVLLSEVVQTGILADFWGCCRAAVVSGGRYISAAELHT